jgi:hypothetical protein
LSARHLLDWKVGSQEYCDGYNRQPIAACKTEVAMNYLVIGVDRQTGKELTLRFDARNAAEAESIASLSMLVSEVREQSPESLPIGYATPEAGGRSKQINWSAGIAFHARLLRILSFVLLAMAVYPLGSYFWQIGASSWSVMIGNSTPTSLLELIAISDRLLLAVTLIVFALVVRLATYVSLAIREIATRSS